MQKIRTLEDAYHHIQSIGICTLFSSKVSSIPALWDIVDLPAEGGGNTKWGARVEAIWAWKNGLPETYPEDIFYGKIPGGHAVLMSMQHLREVHYPKCYKDLSSCSDLAQKIYEIIRLDPSETAEIRAIAIERHNCTKSRFDTAMKQLQITLNIARRTEPGDRKDRWLPFRELYLDFD